MSNAALAAAVTAAGYRADFTSAVVIPTVERTGLLARLRRR